MKVTKITSIPIRDEEGRVYFFVKIDTDKGIHGLGEVGIARQGNAISKAIDHLSELVIGSDPWETERLWQVMFRSSFFPADKIYSCGGCVCSNERCELLIETNSGIPIQSSE